MKKKEEGNDLLAITAEVTYAKNKLTIQIKSKDPWLALVCAYDALEATARRNRPEIADLTFPEIIKLIKNDLGVVNRSISAVDAQ